MQNSTPIPTPVDDLTSLIVLKSTFAQRLGGFSDVFRAILTKLVVDGQDIENVPVSNFASYVLSLITVRSL